MTCCQPPLGIAYLRALLARRQDIAVFPANALDFEVPPDDVYFYRPGEILVPADQADAFEAAARRIGVRTCRCVGGGRPDGEAEDGEGGERTARKDDERCAQWHPSTAVARFVIGAREELDWILDRLGRTAPKLRLSPNHVIFGCPEWGFNPSGEPQVWRSDGDLPSEPPPVSGVVVAVIDSGLPAGCGSNPLLTGVELPVTEEEPWNYRAPSPVLRFPQGHGAFVTGVVRMSAPAASVSSYRALDQDGVTDEWNLAEQIALALAGEPQVVNLSLGTTTRKDEPLMGLVPLQQAATVGFRPIVVASAGNLASDRPFYPAAEDWVIGVAAVEMTGEPAIAVPASFTNYGDWVDTCAVGVDVISAYEAHPYRPSLPPVTIEHFNGAAQWSGTSFAAPRVSGAVAELRAADPGIDRAGVLTAFASGGEALPGLGTFVP